ncbi:MAG: MBL fold metallo-hydrolase [Candidatus Harrisonbacteria bacterium]|nr:MBL fold metallo-hydrolase [Candidatus Harrisonbacteria bacterium]
MYLQLGEQKRSPGATSHLINGDTLVDAGMGIENKKVGENYSADYSQTSGKIKEIFVSHLHFDHIGALIEAAMANPDAVIAMTRPTAGGGEIILRDSFKISSQDQKRAQAEGKEVKPLPYHESDIHKVLLRIRPIDKPGWYAIGSKLVGFYSAGHTRGAAMIFIIIGDKAYFFTGDTCSHNQPLVKGVMLPPKEFFGDRLRGKEIVMITETTYGNRELPKPMPQLQKNYQEFIKKMVLSRIQVLEPSFSDRAPSLLKLNSDMGIASHIDGMAVDFLHLYAEKKWCEQDILLNLDELIAKKLAIIYPKPDKNANQAKYEAVDRHRAETALGSCCGISCSPIISSSAMLDQGRSVQHAERILPNRKANIIFTGYMFPGSIGEEVMRVKKGNTVKLNTWNSKLRKSIEKPVPVSCEVTHFGLSAHDEAPKLVERVARFHELCQELGAELAAVVGHHGNDENYAGFERRVKTLALGIPVFRGLHGVELPL